MQDNPLLIADIGGTNARFAIASNEAPFFDQAQTLQCVEFENIEQATDLYLQCHSIKQLRGICFAVAGPVRDESVSFTNNHWKIGCVYLRQRYKIEDVRLLNDFESIAYSLPQLEHNNIIPIGGDWLPVKNADFTFGVLGPGSGLGIGGLCQREGKLFPLVTEGGHAGFSPENDMQIQILAILHNKFNRVSRERLLSGPGLVNIHEALCEINHQANPGFSAADIAMIGIAGTNNICRQSLDLFFQILGQIAGDTALTMGANQGIFIGGGIVQRYPEQLINSKFRNGFENKGRYSQLMERIPTWLITHKNPGLLGSSIYARSYFR